jgi:predicted DNA-binding transcriptional regulator YafY
VAKGQVLTRWLKLLMTIQGGRPYTVGELARRLGVSVRTIYRDLEHMQDANVPLYYDDEKKAYRLTENFHLPPLHFDSDELLTLITTLGFMRRSGPAAHRRTADALVDKLLAALPGGLRSAAGDLDRVLVIDPLPSRSVEDEQIVTALERAVQTRRRVTIRYAALNQGGQESERTIRPYGLAHRGTALYVIGFCESRQDLRTFRVGRIRTIKVLPQTFEPPADFDLDQYLLDLWGITDGPEMHVRLRFLPQVAQLAQETRWHHTQQVTREPDGGAIVTFTTRGRDELARWLAGYGGNVVVLDPPELREAVLALGRDIVAAYAATHPAHAAPAGIRVQAAAAAQGEEE